MRYNGKLISEMLAQTKYMPEWYYYYGGLADKIQCAVVPVDKPDTFTYILREPVGVCGFIVPWNSPLLLVAWKLAPALAAGCTVVIKPSEYTSASLLEFMKLVIEPLGLPPGVINVVTGYGATAGELFASRCALCHRVAGVSDGRRGPDLTDLASRPTLGAGVIANDAAGLRRWLREHQRLKPGNGMPNHDDVDDTTLDALAAWLEGLAP